MRKSPILSANMDGLSKMYDLLFDYFNEKIDIDRPAFNDLSRYFVPKELDRHEFLVMEGEVCRYNYFVTKGCLRLYSINRDAQENTRYFAFKGKFGTALSSFIQEVPSKEFVQSIGPSSVLSISRNDFYHLVGTFTAFNFIYRDILEMAYVTSLKEDWSIYSRLQFIYNHSLKEGDHNKSYIYVRAGLKKKSLIFGVGANLDCSGAGKFFDDNYGVFIRWEFK